MGLLKRAIKQIPGIERVVRRLNSSQNNSGEWLYSQSVVGWLCRKEFRRQMPAAYRCFGRYCTLQRCIARGRVLGGEFMFQKAQALNRLLGGEDSALLNLGEFKVFLNLRDPRMLQVPNEFLNEMPEAAAVRSLLSEGDTFLDVGANHGSYSIIASKRVGKCGLVVAIEPQPQMASLVGRSLAANAECPFQVHTFACSDREGQAEFYIPCSTSGSAGLFPKFSAAVAHSKLSVQLKRFDDAVDWKNFPGRILLKLDVEGSELTVLRGSCEMIRARKPRIIIEINPKSSQAAGTSVNEIIGFLQGLGYARFAELDLTLKLSPLRELNLASQRNVIIAP